MIHRTSIISAIVACYFIFPACQQKTVSYKYLFQNPEFSVEERVEDLLGHLTIEEKVGQMMHETPAIERLDIPPYDWWNEALHGIARSGEATVFPQAIAMAATFDEKALEETFAIVSDEARAKYNHYQRRKEYDRYKGLTFWTPNINIFRDPRWGRGMETYGEDPYLTSRMGLAVVKGLQGNDPHYFKSHACAKHYAIHSGPEWNRHEFDLNVSPRDLYETYLPAFETLVKEGNVQEVMCAYNRFEGQPCCGHNKLLVDILRNAWAYDGIVVSDCGAIDDFWVKDTRTPRHETHPDRESASIDALRNGTDVECGTSYRALLNAVQNGKLKEEELDVSLRRLLRARFELGMFDPPERVPFSQIPYSVVCSEKHRAQALDMARKSMVLLQNRNRTLPLSKNLKKIAVIGPNANDSTMLWANYHGYPRHTVTILEGIRRKLPHAKIIHEPGCDLTERVLLEDLSASLSANGQSGFAAEFFNNTEFAGKPVYRGIVPELHYTTGGNTQFAPHVSLTNFSARFRSEWMSPVSDDIVFKLSGNDGFRLFIDDEKVAEVWTNEYGSEKSYVLKAEKGRTYSIMIEYIQILGSADLNMTIGILKPVDPAGTAARVVDADAIIFVGGISPRLEGEEMPIQIEGFRKGDRTDIELPQIQRDMLKALKKVGKPVVFVVCTGSALALEWEDKNLDAILNAWYGGEEAGTAVADILFGDYNPSGHLPVTFYQSVNQLPDYENYDMKGRTYRYMTDEPLYPFGYGLSYTTFSYEKAVLSAKEISRNEEVTLSIPVTNTGRMDGDEVIQVYIANPNDPGAPIKTLCAFRRVSIEAGKTQTINFTLTPKAFRSFNDATQTFEIRPGRYTILYGRSSAGKDLKSVELHIR